MRNDVQVVTKHENFTTAAQHLDEITNDTDNDEAFPPSPEKLPSIDLLVNKKRVVGDVQFLFRFVVCGFAKTGTTSLLETLRQHPEIRMDKREWFNFYRNQANGVRKMHAIASKRGMGIMGYKNPHDIQYPSVLNFYRIHAPRTKLVVTVRHPVTWFESFYNYRIIKNELWSVKGAPNNLTINTQAKPSYVNAATGAFHRYLAHLGKTALDDMERQLLDGFLRHDELRHKPPLVPNPVLLVEMRQLGDSNATRSARLLNDLQSYLGLRDPITTIKHVNSIKLTEHRHRKQRRAKMDICLEQFLPIREEMMRVARNASLWIRQYFVKSESVTVSDAEYFDELLESWMHDPCPMRSMIATPTT